MEAAVDPNLFHLDWAQVAEVLATLVVVSFLLERALAFLFEWRLFVDTLGTRGVKEPIAFGVALFVCWYWQFDVLSVVLRGERVGMIGFLVTAAVLAGGSKASLKLFRDVLGIENKYAKQVREKGRPAAERMSAAPSKDKPPEEKKG